MLASVNILCFYSITHISINHTKETNDTEIELEVLRGHHLSATNTAKVFCLV